MMDDDGDDKDDTKRRTRNLSEKKRRDQFNRLINEMSTMICTNNRKLDKSTVLKSTISFLKNHNEVTVRSRAHDVNENWKPTFLSNEEFTYLILEALESFLMVFSANGNIFYVSEGITSLLGHNPADIVNKSIFDLTVEEDRSNLYGLLNSAQTAGDHIDISMEDDPIQFQCHLRRGALDFRDEAVYELIQFNGHFRTNLEEEHRNNRPGYQQDHDSRLLFVCTGRLYTQLIRDVSLVDPNRSEFTSRHSLEWKFLFLDHRAPPIIGYLPFEVLGTSGYDYYHFDDLEKVVTCHEELMQKGELTSCYYRFLTKGQQWIWLQSRFYITYHQWNSKPEFIVCTHRVISYADVATNSNPSEAMDTEAASDVELARQESMKEPPRDGAVVEVSSSYMPEASERYNYPPVSRAQSLKSTSASSTIGTVISVGANTAGTWQRPSTIRYHGSDTNSMSGESWSSQRTAREPPRAPQASPLVPLVPQHVIGAQYLDPSPYFDAVGPAVGPSVGGPVPASPSHAQVQGQLQRKHEQLQQLISQQQEELRQVKKQLLLARLGLLQPLINVPNPYMAAEEMVQNQRLPLPMAVDGAARPLGYHQQPPPHGHYPQLPQ